MKVTSIRPDLVMFPIAIEKIHAAQKPVALLKDLLSRSCDVTFGKVLDPFCGSGTTVLACRQLGLDVVGCEVDKVMYNRALINLVTSPSQGEEE